MCLLLEKYLSNRNMANKYTLSYKMQEINNISGENIGYEFLINTEELSDKEACEIYNESLPFPHGTKCFIRRLEHYIEEGRPELIGKNLFINLERSHLCDKFLLCDIVILFKKSAKKNVNIVIEITERDICGNCKEVKGGLEFLNRNGVPLALDDYDLDNVDFRFIELGSIFYSFIKVDFRSLLTHQIKLEKIIKKHKFKLIIEHVESETERNWISLHAPDTWALQGYLYNTNPVKL